MLSFFILLSEILAPVAQWIEHLTSDQRVESSNLSGCGLCTICNVCYTVNIGPSLRSDVGNLAPVAQWIERPTTDREVVSSNLAWCDLY